MDGFDDRELQQLFSDLQYLSNTKEFEKENKRFLKKEVNKLKRLTIKTAKSKINKKTGNYLKHLKSGKPYKYQKETLGARVYSYSPHAHLIEYGHRLITVDGKEFGFVDGYGIFKNSYNKYKNIYYKNCYEYLDKILKGRGM